MLKGKSMTFLIQEILFQGFQKMHNISEIKIAKQMQLNNIAFI